MRLSSRALPALLVTSALSTPAIAQLAPPPVRQSVDKNGVELFSGVFMVSGPKLSLGQGGQGLSTHWINSGFGWDSNFTPSLTAQGTGYLVWMDGKSEQFTGSGGVYTSTEGDGSTLSGSPLVYTRSDGLKITFGGPSGGVSSMTMPDGKVITYNYASLTYCTAGTEETWGWRCTAHGTMYRLSGISSNFGYGLTPAYGDWDASSFDPNDPSISPGAAGYVTVTGVTGMNLSLNGSSLPTQTVSDTTYGTFWITDPMGRKTTYRMSGASVAGITLPGDSSETITINYTSGRVTSYVTPSGTTTYSSSDSGNVRTVTVTDPLSHVTTYKFDIPSNLMTSFTDPNGYTTSIQHDSYGRVTVITKPEGNYTTWTYDPRGNITQVDQTPKAGSGLSDIITTAGFDTTCTYVAKCNKPNWTKDAKGNETDYTYDNTTGQLLTITSPAATTGGVRPQERFSYTSLQAYYKNSTGSIVASGLPVYRLTSISQCQTGSSCSGTSDEVKTTISYGPQTTGIGNNLLPVSVSKGDGTGVLTATTTNTYDDVGNLTYVDGPLSGTADTTRTLYDADREVVGTISPDPDGAGSLQNRAVRKTIDSRGLLTRVETGTTNGQTDSAWSGFTPAQQVDVIYDTRRRVTAKKLSAGGTAYALTQTDYNADDSVNCVATRMNTAVYASLPSSACTLSTQGSYGPDQITKNNYDPAGQQTSIQVAYGTADQATERTLAYSNNGKLASLTDGENNKTSYVYDGFDRLSQTQYPSSTKGAGTSNSADYEQLTYDPDSNVTQRRVRSGATINFAFDNLNRVTSKTSAALPEVDYTYDLLNRALTAKFTSGQGITNAYDALGRVTSSSSNMGGTAETMSYAYDAAGRRTQLTYPDSYYLNYDRLVTGEISKIRENGASSGLGVLATYAYDNLGERTSRTAGNGTVTSWSHDPVGRLASLTQDLAGTANDLTVTNSYSPASQITGQTRSNDSYAYNGLADVNRGYTSNGLNQYSAAGTASFTYDSNGNLTSDGTNSFAYDAENKLTSATVGGGTATLSYDPLGRLWNVVKGSTNLRFFYDGSDMVAHYDGSGTLQYRYVFGDGADEELLQYNPSAVRTWYTADERGSIIADTSDSGTLYGINSYDEYGIPGSANAGRFQYTGQMWVSELGMYFYKARAYSPTLGRFMQTDPIGYGDGPNWYDYTLNDPVNGSDPSGLTKITCNSNGCHDQNGNFVPGGQVLQAGDSVTTDDGTFISNGQGGGLEYLSSGDSYRIGNDGQITGSAGDSSQSGGGCGSVPAGDVLVCGPKEHSQPTQLAQQESVTVVLPPDGRSSDATQEEIDRVLAQEKRDAEAREKSQKDRLKHTIACVGSVGLFAYMTAKDEDPIESSLLGTIAIGECA